jgi:hypothetical protein
MAIMGMMQMSIDKIINVIAVWCSLMATAGMMGVGMIGMVGLATDRHFDISSS